MRYLILPFIIFILSFIILRTSKMWSTQENWKRIGIEFGVSLLATLLTVVIVGGSIVFF